MRKYYYVRIYQVSKYKGYFESGEEYKEFTVFQSPEEYYKPEAEYTLVDTEKFIIVEKLFPYLVREIKTGIIFPNVNFKKQKYANEDDPEYISYPFGLVHTFVASREGKLIASEVKTLSQLEKYDKLHSDTKKFKQELLNIISIGEINMNNKISRILNRKYQRDNLIRNEVENAIEEKHKIRSLQRKLKQERKNV